MTHHDRHTRQTTVAALLLLTMTIIGCNTQKLIDNTQHSNGVGNVNTDKTGFLRKAIDNAVYAKNISAKADVEVDGKSLPVNTQLQMTSGKMIRLSLTALGLLEVGRVEFTPQYALIIDRVHKEYAKDDYSQVKFMSQNGLNFYTLESLLRNQLFLPGQPSVGEGNIGQFNVDISAAGTQTSIPISYNADKIDYTWLADSRSALINQAKAVYHGSKDGAATLVWDYGQFVNVGKKMFPTLHRLTLSMPEKNKRQRTMQFTLSKIVTTGDYSEPTTPPSKYTKVDFDELFNSIMNL